MNTKVLTSILFGFLALVLVAASASALALSAPATMTDGQKSQNITLTNNDLVSQNVAISIADVSGVHFTVSPSSVTGLANGSSQILNVSVVSVPTDLKFGTYTTTLNAVGTNASTSASVSYVKGFCKSGTAGTNLSLSGIDISNSGDDDLDWKLLDEITVDVDVENNGNGDMRSVVVELALLNSNGKNIAGDLVFDSTDNEQVKLGTIKEDKTETVTFKFRVPATFKDGDYKLAFKAYSDKTGEAKDCIDNSDDLDNGYYQPITVSREDNNGKYIAIDNIVASPDKATCGDTVTLSMDVYNVGNTDLKDLVKINLVNSELGINTYQEITQNMDQGDRATVEFVFKVPQNMQNKRYTFALWSEYDYYKGKYELKSDTNTNFNFEVIGCNVVPVSTNPASISATLESTEVVAGKDVVVKATITNLKNSTADFAIDAKNFDSWAKLSDVSDRLINLAPGQSKDVTFTFAVNSDAEGAKSFTVEAVSAGATAQREVELSVQKAASMFSALSGNALIWVIGAVNLILIIFIIIVAVKLTRN